MTIDAIILNRNLRDATERLFKNLESVGEISKVYVTDAGSGLDEVAQGTFVRDDSASALKEGLRICRGYNLGISRWIGLSSDAEWVLLLPNDAEIISAEFRKLMKSISGYPSIVAVIPISEDNPYGPLLDESGVGLGWLFYEGPILLRSEYIRYRNEIGSPLFDHSNFRGFASFLELAFQIYATNRGVAVTNLVSFSENNEYLIGYHHLIGTEPYDENLKLLLSEGEKWLARKYGFTDRRNLENATRLLFEEFVLINPDVDLLPAQ
jgi:hypothetical protein